MRYFGDMNLEITVPRREEEKKTVKRKKQFHSLFHTLCDTHSNTYGYFSVFLKSWELLSTSVQLA